MAWAQVKKNPYADYDACPRPMASYQLSKIAEILWVNQQGALEKQLHPGR